MTFLIQFLDGRTFKPGDTNPTPLGDPGAVLRDFEHNGDYVDFGYSGGLTVSVHETKIEYVATLDG